MVSEAKVIDLRGALLPAEAALLQKLPFQPHHRAVHQRRRVLLRIEHLLLLLCGSTERVFDTPCQEVERCARAIVASSLPRLEPRRCLSRREGRDPHVRLHRGRMMAAVAEGSGVALGRRTPRACMPESGYK